MLVQDVMTPDPITVRCGTSIKEALTRLAHLEITSLPVVDDRGQLIGIVSELDLIRDSVARDPRAQELPVVLDRVGRPEKVEDVYTRQALTLRPHDDVARAVEVMSTTAVKSIPIVDDQQRLVGVLSRSDVVLALARSDELIAADLDEVLGSLGHTDWLVEVREGVVDVTGPTGAAERSLAHVVAHTVLGVVDVRIS
jgi:CBS-domain-containing membrane protein